MRGEDYSNNFIILADMNMYLSHVHSSVCFELKHSNEKYKNCIEAFANSKMYPVPLSTCGMFYEYDKGIRSFYMNNGITRIQFLKDNGAKWFPVFCPILQFREFLSKIGIRRPFARPVISTSEIFFRHI